MRGNMCNKRDQIRKDWNKGDQNNKSGTCGRVLKLFVVGILLAGMCAVGAGEKVSAERNPEGNFEDVLSGYSISIQAEMLPSSRDTYDIRLTVENSGENWEGTMRLLVDMARYGQPCAYDTVLSLPQGSTKQFVVKVPKDSLENMDGTVQVTLLDRKSRKCAEKEFPQLLREDANALAMGILSDAYSTLTYLDMGGQEIYFNGDYYPLRLEELTQENLSDALDTLTFLVIDRYNTGVLTEDETAAVERWAGNGGVLLVGTGSYAEDTLRGLDNLGIRCREIHEPGQSAQDIMAYADVDFVDFSRLSLAELSDVGGQYQMGEGYVYVRSLGSGAVGILPYALTELAGLDKSAYVIGQEDFVLSILNAVAAEASSRYNSSYSSSYDNQYILQRSLRILGNSSNQLNFGALKGIVMLYVIFAGPILYLILRTVKKRELYWAAVPVTALVGILLVFLAGRGFEVASTRVYSVAVENLADRGNGRTYLHCYDADHREWDLRLAAGHEYVGPFTRGSYSYGQEGNYYHHIRREGDTLFFGINPTSNFEDSYFCAGGVGGEINGDLVCDDIRYGWAGLSGTIRNETDRDFCYYEVIVGNEMYVFENLPAGETRSVSVSDAIYTDYRGYNSVWNAFLYDFMADLYDEGTKEDLDALAALGVGGCAASAQNESAAGMVIGVTKNWEKAVDDTCSEASYGCFYKVW